MNKNESLLYFAQVKLSFSSIYSVSYANKIKTEHLLANVKIGLHKIAKPEHIMSLLKLKLYFWHI